jgi:hypothetical protein
MFLYAHIVTISLNEFIILLYAIKNNFYCIRNDIIVLIYHLNLQTISNFKRLFFLTVFNLL